MPESFRAIRTAMAVNSASTYTWDQLMADLWPVISSPPTWEAELLLLDIIRFNGQIHLAASSEFPHSMAPEDMLKAIAIQSLARWTGLAHLHDMQKLQLATSSSSLSSLVRDVIRKTRESIPVESPTDFEKIQESSPDEEENAADSRLNVRSETRGKTVTLEKDRGMSFIPGRRSRMRNSQLEPVC